MASTSPGCKEATTDRWNGKEYSTKALAAQWRPRPEKAFRAYEATRARSAVYDYLTPVYEFAIGFDGWPDADKVGLAMLASTELGLRSRACLQRGSIRSLEFPFIQRDTLQVDGPAVAAP